MTETYTFFEEKDNISVANNRAEYASNKLFL